MVKKEYVCDPGRNSKIVIYDFDVEIIPGSTIMLGFASAGFLGQMVVSTLVQQIPDIREIGFISSEYLPPISVFDSGVLRHSFRIYYTPRYNLIIGVCDVHFHIPSAYNDLARTIINWALSEDVLASEIVVFQGILQEGIINEYPVYYAAEEHKTDYFESLNLKKFERGIITGPEATIINEALTTRLDVYALFAPVLAYPTPEAAAAIIEVLNKIYNMNIETKELIEEGIQIKEQLLNYMNKAKEEENKRRLSQLNAPEGYTMYFQ